MRKRTFHLLWVFIFIIFVEIAQAVTMEYVPVGNPGNRGELSGGAPAQPEWICGGVDYNYQIGKYEVTTGQYVEFLNAVAQTDTYELYNPEMWTNDFGCKIQRSGDPGSYTYQVAPDRENRPVNYISFWDACRFANWMNNGQASGEQTPSTTEDGAYELYGYTGIDGRWIERQPDARVFLPSEDEWYKAAYHKNDGVTSNFWDYPTQSNTVPSNELINPDPGNNANRYDDGYTIGAPYYLTEVGEFENSDSPYGTFDMLGNVWEWNDTIIDTTTYYRGQRGGAFDSIGDKVGFAMYRSYTHPDSGRYMMGFRIATVPEPATCSLLALGGLLLRKRRR